jgi:hypothetical protein
MNSTMSGPNPLEINSSPKKNQEESSVERPVHQQKVLRRKIYQQLGELEEHSTERFVGDDLHCDSAKKAIIALLPEKEKEINEIFRHCFPGERDADNDGHDNSHPTADFDYARVALIDLVSGGKEKNLTNVQKAKKKEEELEEKFKEFDEIMKALNNQYINATSTEKMDFSGAKEEILELWPDKEQEVTEIFSKYLDIPGNKDFEKIDIAKAKEELLLIFNDNE